MAVIDKLPAQKIIDGYRGLLDFYCYKGLNVVRQWPRSPGINRTWLVLGQADKFGHINKISSQIDRAIHDELVTLVSGQPYTWRDMLTRFYLSGQTHTHQHRG